MFDRHQLMLGWDVCVLASKHYSEKAVLQPAGAHWVA
jgi:hypothetical protein